jgi:DNA-binding SARP family transcriptional activator
LATQAPNTGVDPAQSVRTENPTGDVRLCLLDGFQLTRLGYPLLVSPTGQRLLAFLALSERAVSRVYVAGTLWPDVPEERSSANLRSTIWRLPRAQPPLVETSMHRLRLGPSIAVDVREAVDAAHRALEGQGSAEQESLDLGRFGDLLLDWYDDWILAERERFHQLRLHALEVICERLTGARKFGQAVEAGLAAVSTEPLRESAQRVLIRVHLAEGNHVQALRQYESYRRQLRHELSLEPSEQMEQLVRPLRT